MARTKKTRKKKFNKEDRLSVYWMIRLGILLSLLIVSLIGQGSYVPIKTLRLVPHSLAIALVAFASTYVIRRLLKIPLEKPSTHQRTDFLVSLLLFIAFSFYSGWFFNGAFDFREPEIFEARVISTYTTGTTGTTNVRIRSYYVIVERSDTTGGPLRTFDFPVNFETFQQVYERPGTRVMVTLAPGALGSPWVKEYEILEE